MGDPHVPPAEEQPGLAVTDSQHSSAPASPKVAPFDEAALLQRMFWSVPETAFLMRVGLRTVWRLMADPKSKFPKPRRVRGRTLLGAAEVLRFMAEGASR
jgi:predicted DNA-binding transcriptional regulator AlpA